MSVKLLQLAFGIVCVGLAIGELRVVHKLVGGHLTAAHEDDVELITSSAGAGRDSKKKKSEDEKKTLSQQVADGKYGLIQTEIFSKPAKRPGIISYKDNDEVPGDNAKNLGGLSKNDIWLSENHLLVIKGGTYPPYSERTNVNASPIWPPIDDYRAPQRQVKIPKHPKVPPPFPVQLTDDGPLLLLGTNASTTLNESYGSQLYPLYAPENYPPEDGAVNELPHTHPANVTPGEAPFAVPPYAPDNLGEEYNSTDGYPPALNLPPLFPFFGPGAALPPLDNITNQYDDDDDTSIYYPPPYSFYYQKDNSSKVAAGPLVPGIVLPPPPDFFAPLEDETTTTNAPITSTTETTTTRSTKKTQPPDASKAQVTQAPRKKYPTIAILKPVTAGGLPGYGTPTSKDRTAPSTTQVPPLKAYYPTTYKLNPILVTQKPNRTYLPSKFRKTTVKPPARYYFYEENDINTTPKQQRRPQYYDIAGESYEAKPPRSSGQNVQYYFINGENVFDNFHARMRTTKKPDSFSIHIAHLQDQIHSRQPPPPQQNRNYHQVRQQVLSPKPVYQYSFEAANYPNRYPQNPLRHYEVQIQEAVEVTTPIYETSQRGYYQNPATENPIGYHRQNGGGYPKAISQYSFEATPNPIYEQYYTKHDEKYIDDVTKQHFTVFGKKLPGGTTPIPRLPEYQGPTPRDAIVDYLNPQRRRPINQQSAEYHDSKPYNVEYRPAYDDYVPPVRHSDFRYPADAEERRPYVTYKLPGDDGTHFYFITPQLAQKREQNSNFYFSRPNASRSRDK